MGTPVWVPTTMCQTYDEHNWTAWTNEIERLPYDVERVLFRRRCTLCPTTEDASDEVHPSLWRPFHESAA